MKVGIDMVEANRFSMIKKEHYPKIFTKKELEYALEKNVPMRLASIFAVKEAFLKAVGIGLYHGIDLLDMEVQHLSSGKPILVLSQEVKKQYDLGAIDISISHTKDCCVAICIIEEK